MEEKSYEMTIDGKKTVVSEKVLASRGMREKKVEVEVNGKIIRVSRHMVDDINRFGGALIKRPVKNTPSELLKLPESKKIILLPKQELTPEVVKEPVIDEVKPPVIPDVVKEVIPPKRPGRPKK
jgi:hypothetical protein